MTKPDGDVDATIERVLVSLAYALGVMFILLAATSWLATRQWPFYLWPVSAASATLLLTVKIYRGLRQSSSRPRTEASLAARDYSIAAAGCTVAIVVVTAGAWWMLGIGG